MWALLLEEDQRRPGRHGHLLTRIRRYADRTVEGLEPDRQRHGHPTAGRVHYDLAPGEVSLGGDAVGRVGGSKWRSKGYGHLWEENACLARAPGRPLIVDVSSISRQ